MTRATDGSDDESDLFKDTKYKKESGPYRRERSLAWRFVD